MKKVLIMYARYGSGHKSIAEYVYNYIKENNKDVEIKIIDMTDYANKLGRIGLSCFNFVASHRNAIVFDSCYRILNHRVTAMWHNKFTKQSYDNAKLRREIEKYNPDITLSSHFYCSNIINYYNKIGIIHSKIYSILTDYSYHEFWIRNYKTETGYIVANEVVKNELITRGIPSKKIHVFGLPLNLSKIKELDKEETILKRYNLSGSRKIYLFFGGSTMGNMYYYDYFKALAKLNLNADVIFISGKNTKLKSKCDEYVKKNKIKNIKVLGYSNDVLNLMKISDLVISKPGGATITECLEMNTPMLLVPGIGGQEAYNAKFISKNGFGIRVRRLWTFKEVLNRLEQNPELIIKMRNKLEKIERNKSVKKINDLIMKG